MLSPARQGLTTASTAPIIIHGSNAERYQLWLERTGQAEPEDLTNVFAVQWGKHAEPFVLDWIERVERAEITERQLFCRHPTLPISGTLDGFRPHDNAVIEAKVVSPFSAPQTTAGALGFVDYYSPQVVVQRVCRGAQRGLLAAQQGNSAPQLFEVTDDPAYERQVLALLMQFHEMVEKREPPGPVPPAPVPPERWRTVSLDRTELSNWERAMIPTLRLWSDTRETAAIHEQSKKDVKLLLPDDVGRVTYGPITIKRARNNAVTISEAA